MLVLDDDLLQAVPCPVPQSSQADTDMSKNYHPTLESVVRNHKALFSCQLGKTNVARHVIDTSGLLGRKGERCHVSLYTLFQVSSVQLPCSQ